MSQHLGDDEVTELGVLGDPASHPHGDHVSKSLYLMDDSLRVGLLQVILIFGLPVLANYPVNLLLYFDLEEEAYV